MKKKNHGKLNKWSHIVYITTKQNKNGINVIKKKIKKEQKPSLSSLNIHLKQ